VSYVVDLRVNIFTYPDINRLFIEAVRYRNIKKVGRFLNVDPPPEINSKINGLIVLKIASEYTDLSIIKLLIERGVEVSSNTFIITVTSNNSEKIIFLVKNSIHLLVYVNTRYENNQSGLYYAIEIGSDEAARYLIKLKTDLTLKNDLGRTPVFVTCGSPRASLYTLELLTNSGGRLNDQDYDKNIYFYAISRTNKRDYIE
jgi:ankyrin repeat protein